MKKLITFSLLILICKLVAQPAGWMYNLPIQVQNSNAVNAVDYQLKITVNTQNLISSGQMLASGNDIRFSDGCTSTNFFNYWIEGGLNTPTTAIWVKIPLIAANTSSTVFMFYGNATATAVSAIQGTFRGPNSATDSVFGGTSGGLLVCQRGFRFAPTQNLLVTHFGKNEPTGSTRYVTLFNYSTQAILTQTQVSGPAATYSYGPIANPIWLTTGTQYVLQIYGLATDGYYFGTSSQIGQHLTYFDMQYSNGGTQNTFPNSTLANYHYGYGDFWYYITNTLTTIPSYTMGASNVSIISPYNAVCSGGTMTLSTNATGSYTWSTGAQTASITVTPTTTTTYSVAQTGTSGCTSNAFLTINVSGTAPVLSINSSTNQTCLGKTATLTASGALTYTWTNGVTNGVSFNPSVTTTYMVSGQNGCGTTTAVTTISVAPIAVSLITTPTVICAGQPAVISAAAAANSYTWLPINVSGSTNSLMISPQVTTTYTTIVSDGTCAGTATITLAANPIPTVSIVASATAGICDGDAVTLTATGGNNYTWTPGNLSGASITVNPNAPTAYFVTGDNSFGCTAITSQAIITNSLPIVVLTANSNFVCVGDPVNLSASGAASYAWSAPGSGTSITVNPLSSSVYTVTGTTNNCSSTQTIDVTVFDPIITITGPANVCDGVTASLSATGAGNYTWSTGSLFSSTNITPTITTVYSVSALTTSGSITCPSAASIQVNVDPNPTVTVVASRTTMCKGESVDVVASGANLYSWSNAANTASIVVTSSLITVLNYTVTGTNSQGCSTSAVVQIKVNGCTALSENQKSLNRLSIFPNPNSGNFTVRYTSAIELKIVNELGQLVKKLNLDATSNFEAPVSNLAKGIYFVIGEQGTTRFNEKIIVD